MSESAAHDPFFSWSYPKRAKESIGISQPKMLTEGEVGPRVSLAPNGRGEGELSILPFLAADFKSLSIPILSKKGKTHTQNPHLHTPTQHQQREGGVRDAFGSYSFNCFSEKRKDRSKRDEGDYKHTYWAGWNSGGEFMLGTLLS